MRTLAWNTKNFRFTREQNKHIRIAADRIYSFYFKILLIRSISPTTYQKKHHSIRFQRLLFQLTVSAGKWDFSEFQDYTNL